MVLRKSLIYMIAFVGPILLSIGLLKCGAFVWTLPVYAFVLVPVLGFIIPKKQSTFSKEEEAALLASPIFDISLYALLAIHWTLLLYFLSVIDGIEAGAQRTGLILALGTHGGGFAINVAHELGHRKNRWERILAQLLLLSSLYVHFIVEHNRGHHRYVATPKDPASARIGESIYAFWIRSVIMSWRSAWNIEAEEMRKKGRNTISMHNEMVIGLLVQLGFVGFVAIVFGTSALVAFLWISLIGILLLEAVNYIEHYGLRRATGTNGKPVK